MQSSAIPPLWSVHLMRSCWRKCHSPRLKWIHLESVYIDHGRLKIEKSTAGGMNELAVAFMPLIRRCRWCRRKGFPTLEICVYDDTVHHKPHQLSLIKVHHLGFAARSVR